MESIKIEYNKAGIFAKLNKFRFNNMVNHIIKKESFKRQLITNDKIRGYK